MGISSLFLFDKLAIVLGCFIVLMSGLVAAFSYRYLHGDSAQNSFFLKQFAICILCLGLVFSNHLLLIFLFWSLIGILLARMIGHNKKWVHSFAASRLSFWYLLLGSAALLVSVLILGVMGQNWRLSELNASLPLIPTGGLWLSGILIVIAAMIGSGLFPFHKWLMSSLNAPTPVSALMHAGIINAGGVLLCRFSSFFEILPVLYEFVFLLGALSAFLGAFWMKTQTEIKRGLVTSTLSQMGFMMMQIGLGFFSLAILHIILHGFYKSFQFLNTGSSISPQSIAEKPPLRIDFKAVLFSGLGALLSGGIIIAMTGKTVFPFDSGSLLIGFAAVTGGVAGLGVSQSRLGNSILNGLVFFLGLSGLSMVYSGLFVLISRELGVDQNMILGWGHLIGVFGYLIAVIGGSYAQRFQIAAIYIRSLNGAQAHPDTVLGSRRGYYVE